jgi:hypothetical protein
MKSFSDIQPDVYQVIGDFLHIHWNIEQVAAPSMGEPRTQWSADEAVVNKAANRSQIIEAIIGSVFTTGAEIAVINNQTSDPATYVAYQEFRVQAKQLADGWLNDER